jgi:hypothetical protein
MATAITCFLMGSILDTEAALRIRGEAKARRQSKPTFLCTECGEMVDPHREGGRSPAHFEHRARNSQCSLSAPLNSAGKAQSALRRPSWITTAELASRTAGGDDYIRTKESDVKGLALRFDLNEKAPEIVVVGRGPRIESRARLFLSSRKSVPTYVKRGTNAWELIGSYCAVAYRTDSATIQLHCGDRPINKIAGILFLERTDEVSLSIRGGGFADPETRKEVELAAIRFVQAHFENSGYVVHDHQRDNLGYDLLAVKSDSLLKLEVKGTDGIIPRFFLTRNERKCASREDFWLIAMVTNARSNPQMQLLTLQELESMYRLDALAWECTPLVTSIAVPDILSKD